VLRFRILNNDLDLFDRCVIFRCYFAFLTDSKFILEMLYCVLISFCCYVPVSVTI
jgi:hypothetical protein